MNRTMKAIVTTGNGGYDKLVYRDVPMPEIGGGVVVNSGSDVERRLLDKRVLIRPCIRAQGFGSLDNIWMGSDFDGAFAEYVKIPASEVFPNFVKTFPLSSIVAAQQEFLTKQHVGKFVLIPAHNP